MMSLSRRILLSAILVLLIFIVGIALTLDRAFHESARLGVQDRMLARLLMLMGDAEVEENGELDMPTNLLDTEFSRPNASTYGYIIDRTKTVAWQSTSALNKAFPELELLDKGVRDFKQIDINGQSHFIYRFGVAWKTETGSYPLTFNVITDTVLFDAQVERYREDLWGWLSVMAILLLITQMLVLHWGLQPMRRVSTELAAIESGEQENVNGVYPRELKLLTDSINSLINHERKQQKRYRNGLADLAHSLKTPLAVLQGAAIAQNNEQDKEKAIREQIERMDNIIQYQLRRAATAGSSPGMRLILLEPVVDRIITTVQKAYHDKHPVITREIDKAISLRIDEGDLMELLGNLIDNAFKWCDQKISLCARQRHSHVIIQVKDDGPGIQQQEVDRILERGIRVDQSIPGHGIGLAIVRDIIQVYEGELFIEKNEPAGACITVYLENK